MRLTELAPHFQTYGERTITEDDLNPVPYQQRFMQRVETLAEAQGIFFACPKCFAQNGGLIGTHYIDVTFAGRGVPDHLGSHNKAGTPTRWEATGTGLNDLTTKPSILLEDGCAWHGFITNGDLA